MYLIRSTLIALILGFFAAGTTLAATEASVNLKDAGNNITNQKCARCHLKENKSLVLQWENSPHAAARDGQIGCYTCHAAEKAMNWVMCMRAHLSRLL